MRLFIGIPVPAGLALQAAAADVKKTPGARPVPDGSWHITLRFLGEVDDPGEVVDTMVAACRGHRPLQAVVEGLHTFPSAFPPDSRAKVAWAGVRAHGLERLAEDIVKATQDFGEPAEKRPFVGHVTLARFPKATDLRTVVEEHRDTLFFQGPLDRVVLYRTTPGRDGSAYQALHTARLGEA